MAVAAMEEENMGTLPETDTRNRLVDWPGLM